MAFKLAIGHDWGVPIGLQYAAAHPDNVVGVAMFESQALLLVLQSLA